MPPTRIAGSTLGSGAQSVVDDRARIRDHVLPVLGKLEACAFTRDDVESVRDDLDDKIVRGDLARKPAASSLSEAGRPAPISGPSDGDYFFSMAPIT